jgi:diacylglycerol kinase (ATP)
MIPEQSCRRNHKKEVISFMSNQHKPNGTGLTRLLKAGVCSWKGFTYIWKNEAAFRQEMLLCAFCVPLGLLLGNTGLKQALLIGSVLAILLIEIINSAIECVVDRIGSEQHELSAHAKDLGSSAVFMAIFITAVVWILVLCSE